MMPSMMRIIAAVAIALAISNAAYGQTQTFHDAAGRVTGKARIDSNGVTTFTDAAGRVTGKVSSPRR
jgi:hypothetical protein